MGYRVGSAIYKPGSWLKLVYRGGLREIVFLVCWKLKPHVEAHLPF